MSIKTKPFDLAAALRGEPIVTGAGVKVKIEHVEIKLDYPLISSIGNSYTFEGKRHADAITPNHDLFMLDTSLPEYVPWTFDNCPIGLEVKGKDTKVKAIITTCSSDRVSLGGDVYTYDNLMLYFTTKDGSPCGTLKSND